MKSVKARQKQKRRIYASTICSVVFCFISGFVKLGLSIYIKSYFLTVSSVFSLMVGLIKLLVLFGLENEKKTTQIALGYVISGLMTTNGIVYSIYAAKLLSEESVTNYGIIPAIFIAVFSFISIFISVIGLFKRRGRNCIFRSLKNTNFTIALTDIMWTYIALSAAINNTTTNSLKTATYIGLIIGIISIILSIFNLRYVIKENKSIL